MTFKATLPVILIYLLFLNVKGQEERIGAIHSIVVSDGILLQIEQAEEYTLDIKTQDLEQKCLIKTIEEGVLTLKIVSGFGCSGKVMATLKCPSVTSLEIMGMAEVSTKNLYQGDRLEVTLKSGGKAYVDLDIEHLKVEAGGGSSFYAEGYAVNQDISVSVSASFDGHKLEGEYVDVTASLGGIAKVCATERLTIEAGTNTWVNYACEPKQVVKDVKGSAKVEAASEE
jgi:hypothetical protein